MLRCLKTNGWTIGRILGAGTLLLLPSLGSADPSQASGWDHHHMQSNLATAPAPLAARPILIGTASSSTTIGVTEQILTISPHGWEPGGPRSFASSRPKGVAATDFSRPLSMSGIRASARNSVGSESQRHSRSR